MTEQFDRLKRALSDRYTIEREIGSGGMATVYLAEDLKHHRMAWSHYHALAGCTIATSGLKLPDV